MFQYDLESLTTYAVDNYLGSENESLAVALAETKAKITRVTQWMTMSGLKINEKKTDLCIFHRIAQEKCTLEIDGTQIESSSQINILGLIFDSNTKWDPHYDNAIKEPNKNLHAIKIIAKYFNTEEKKTLLTSLFYSKLYYGSEVWHLPGRSMAQNKKLKFASANAVRSCDRSMTIYNTHTEIHINAKRALPDQMINY